jgi:hypothetical protein
VTDALTLDELRVKVGNGITWLSERDPRGLFYFHWQANEAAGGRRGLGAEMKPPKNWTSEQVRAYGEWRSALLYWFELDALLEKREKKELKP